MRSFPGNSCEQSEATCAYAAQALAASEVAAAEAHIAACPDCQHELESLRPVIDSFVSWPADVLRPTTSLQARLALRIAEETGKEPVLPPARRGEQAWSEPEWEEVAPGIECKLLATDTERHRVSMLVRLAPGATYPAHTHAGAEVRAPKSCISSTASCGSTSASCSRATTITVRRERTTSASGARRAAPVCSSPAPRTFFADMRSSPNQRFSLPEIERVPFGMHACRFYSNPG
jgi:hypothetical protein